MKRRALLLLLAALMSAGAYLLLAGWRGAPGFPLDDAWIHQVYARNLAARGEFAFFAGQPSAGSTSPLWTLLLSIGCLLHLDFRVWAYLLGIASLAASAFLISRLAEQIFAQRSTQHTTRVTFHASRFTSHLSSLLLSLFLVFEWHLVWSAASGMEIPLFIFLSLLLLERFCARERAWMLGLLAGLLTLTRPEGIVLGTLVGLGLSLRASCAKQSPSRESGISSARSFNCAAKSAAPLRMRLAMTSAIFYAFGFAIVFAPYLFFNLTTGGAIFPNTFYAKSAEYAEIFAQAPLILRWLELLFTPFIGAQILLIPGLIYGAIILAHSRQWSALIPFVWMVALPALYALRLPVAYQHGRYEMPIIPFIVLYGVGGTAALLARVQNFVVRATWTLSIAATLIAFWFIGAAQYATDVVIIDCEMVQTARWITVNAPADAVVAAHDIGALGYFYERPFIDLAGLVSPEVIPFIRDEGRLRDYLVSRKATFVIVFPDWYPAFDADPRFVPVHQTNCAVTRAAGEKNIIVYRIVQ